MCFQKHYFDGIFMINKISVVFWMLLKFKLLLDLFLKYLLDGISVMIILSSCPVIASVFFWVFPGIDNVDLQSATEFGCLVVNAPTANIVAAAEPGIALLAAMARNIA
ncbi:hypothetical protein RJT34_31628 [Clitoria ternatea]|uniref:D-isomer specific 2-hydroxyacid dehydrogenase catalytic domain-containing protein n=1 Tax=Clitoria ternatea TaxID=43366 RepID=A0AAN9I8K8_CLITE